MNQPIVFVARCRPQDADPIEIVLRERRVFIGWPAWRPGIEPERGHLRKAIVDLRCSDDEWNALKPKLDKYKAQYQQNRNLVNDVREGSIVLVPRPKRGTVYAGRIKGPFELLNDPPWLEDYLHLRDQQKLRGGDPFSHMADVAQSWEVDRFRQVPFPLIPAWIRRSLLGRSTYARIRPITNGSLHLDPYSVLDTLIEHPGGHTRTWTDDIAEIERRLIDGIGPNTFEHLCVALLQLEEPDHIWVHVGGSGDGGVDGIGADATGRPVGLLQCKWEYWNQQIDFGAGARQKRRVIASLLHPANVQFEDGIEFWTRHRIASLVLNYAARLPIATSLRIGSPQAMSGNGDQTPNWTARFDALMAGSKSGH